MDQDFHKIRCLPPYVFAEFNAMKAEAANDAEAIKAAEDKLQLEMAEAEEARLVAEREKAEAEETHQASSKE